MLTVWDLLTRELALEAKAYADVTATYHAAIRSPAGDQILTATQATTAHALAAIGRV